MTTYCTMCKAQLDEGRTFRGSRFCSQNCANEYARQRRSLRAGRACRLCGRLPRLPRKGKPLCRVGTGVETAAPDLLEGKL
jgi:hypothetical protein